MTIRVALIDDHPMVVGGLEAALATIDDIVVVARGATMGDAREILARPDVDVALLDIRLADGNGIQLLADLGADRQAAVIVISSFRNSQYVAAAVRYGAQGFLLKTVPLADVAEAIRRVADGGSAFTADQLRQGFVALTPRERQVVRLVIKGSSNDEIGAEIGASRKTVESHLSRIFERYGITGGRIELSLRAEQEGWLDITPPDRTPSGQGRA